MGEFAPLIGGEPTNDSDGISRLRWVALVNDDTTTTLGLGQLSPQFGHGGSMASTGLADGSGSLHSPCRALRERGNRITLVRLLG